MSEMVSIVAAAMTVAGAVVTSVLTYRATRKRDVTTDALTTRRDTIADRDALIETLQKDVLNLKAGAATDKADTAKDVAELRSEVRLVRNHNHVLTTFIYKMLAILRIHNLIGEINPHDVPEDIHI